MAKILVCDDDREIVEAIDIYLTQEGYEVLKAYDGEEALRVLKTQKADLLVLDGLPRGFVNILLHYFCYSFPFSYPGMFLEAPDKDRLFMTIIALSVTLAGAALGACRYCSHQVR